MPRVAPPVRAAWDPHFGTAGPCSICGICCGAGPDAKWSAVLTVIGRWCQRCYSAFRLPSDQEPQDRRAFQSRAAALGLRVTAPASRG